jgi:cellulose synthase/poly-beta-1,6-N-acetylglucosamine synthase-like glycosyltransferase
MFLLQKYRISCVMADVIYLVSAILFAVRILLIIRGARRERSKRNLPAALPQRFVSVIIPARDEEKNIGNSVRSVACSDYPVELYEIIVVNDRSSDATGEMLSALGGEIPNLRIVTVTQARTEVNLKGKPGALDAGIYHAKGEILLMTDADCTVSPDWIAAMCAQFDNPEVGLTAAFTTIRPQSFFQAVQAVEWTLNHTMAQAGVGLQQPLGCFGNNLAVRASVYREIGGYAGIPFSVTEDLALLQAVHASRHELRYVCHHTTAVETIPCLSFAEYLSQHQRWAKGGLGLGWRAVVFVGLSATLAVSLATAVFTGNYLLLPVIIAVRLAGDVAVIYPSLSQLRRNDLRVPAIFSVLFLMALEMLIPLVSLKKTVWWKGQKF